uniref:KxYKxGKxW signal domain protein n=1 Tax=Streptococcus sanguinis SK678 TaxID=888819 RepID=UPI0013AE8733|nr:Chain A, KxYKxGKxW signal domain protein [Streptococcus sanguinis SK678]6EFI_B Chain B, KxYKxGKxW signal domain protein [Streptococcus sanguinis SK678]
GPGSDVANAVDTEAPQVKTGDYVVYRGESFEFYAEITDNSGQVNDVVVRNVELDKKTSQPYLTPGFIKFSTDNLGLPGNATVQNPLRTKIFGTVPLNEGIGYYTRYVVPTDSNGNTTRMVQNDNRNGLERFIITIKTQNEKYNPADPAITYVNQLSNLSQAERDAVAAAVRTANPQIPAAARITVSANGTVTITYPDSSTDTIPADRVVKDLAS